MSEPFAAFARLVDKNTDWPAVHAAHRARLRAMPKPEAAPVDAAVAIGALAAGLTQIVNDFEAIRRQRDELEAELRKADAAELAAAEVAEAAPTPVAVQGWTLRVVAQDAAGRLRHVKMVSEDKTTAWDLVVTGRDGGDQLRSMSLKPGKP